MTVGSAAMDAHLAGVEQLLQPDLRTLARGLLCPALRLADLWRVDIGDADLLAGEPEGSPSTTQLSRGPGAQMVRATASKSILLP